MNQVGVGLCCCCGCGIDFFFWSIIFGGGARGSDVLVIEEDGLFLKGDCGRRSRNTCGHVQIQKGARDGAIQ